MDLASESTNEHAAPATDPGGVPGGRLGFVFRSRRRRILAVAVGVVAAVVVFGVVTAFTGLPAPGPLRRYKASELHELVDAIHADAGPLRTPDDCWQTLEPDFPSGDRRPIATIDWIRSRVVVGMRSDNVGEVDARTRTEVEQRVRAVVAAHPDLSMGMVELEASPEGWSPRMSCALVVRGWGGF